MIGLSLIIPFYNEEVNLPKLHRELLIALKKMALTYEVLYIDDGSTDDSLKVLKKTLGSTSKIKILKLRKNFGQTAATMAGIDQAKGKIIGFLDADLQNNPNDLPKLLTELDRHTDAVVGWRKIRHDSHFHNLSTKFINFITSAFFKIPLHDMGCSMKVIKKEVLKDLRLYGEFHRLLPIILYWRGVRIKEVVVEHRPRKYGQSKYNYLKIIRFLLDLLTIKFLDNYGTRPAYIFGLIGLASCLVSFVPLGLTAYEKMFSGIYVHRNPLFTIFIFLFLIGVQFVFMGLIGELLVRIYYESQNRKTYELKN